MWADFRAALEGAFLAACPELGAAGRVTKPATIRRQNLQEYPLPFGMIRIPQQTAVSISTNAGQSVWETWPELVYVHPGGEDEAGLLEALDRLVAWFDDDANQIRGAQKMRGRWTKFDDDEPMNDYCEAKGVQALAGTLAVQFRVAK